MISRQTSSVNHSSPMHHLKPTGNKRLALLIASIVLVVSAAGGAFLTTNLSSLGIAHADGGSPVLTYKGDNYRTGSLNETILNKENVNTNQFGKLVSYPVDGQVYTEPLYVPGLTINGSVHNVTFVETENDTVYAFDADQTTPTAPLWSRSLLNGGTPASNLDVSCNDMVPNIGITGTPVIDSSTNTMYLVALTKENGNLIYRLYALNITTGQNTVAPTVIQGSVPGTGQGSANGKVTFTPTYERQRSALLLVNGQIYMSFASFCDHGPYHGWIFGYNTQLQQTAIYNDTPNGLGGGIWGAGNALASDDNGDIYTISGNGDFNLNSAGLNANAGDSFAKLSPQLKVLDYFSPFNQLCLQQADADLGSGGPLLIPDTNEQIGVGKEGRIYVLNNSNMGKYTNDPNLSCSSSSTERLRTNIDKVVQELPPSTIGGEYNTPTYWNGTVYFTGARDSAKAFTFSNGMLATTPTSHTAQTFAFTGGGSTISSNGTDPNTGILWTIDPSAILRAYDATNLSDELYDSSMNASRDGMSSNQFVKFTIPTIADGKVFVPTANSLNIYGLLPTTPTPTPTGTTTPTPVTPTPTPVGSAVFNNVGISDDTAPGSGNFDNAKSSYSSTTLRNAGINAGDNTFYNGMVFTWPDATSGSPDNYIPDGQTVAVTPLANANILGFLGAASGGPSIGQATINYTDGSKQSITLGFSDWTLGAGKQPISYGNGKLATLPYRNTPNGFQMVTTYVFYSDVAMQSGKTVQSVTLPTTTVGGTMHIFAIATKAGTVATNPSPTVPYNNVGTSDDRVPASGAFDGSNSYSAQATQSVGLIPGATVNAYGTNFVWPSSDPAFANNYAVKGQVIPITPVSNAGTLAFLGASSNGTASGNITITYTDVNGNPQHTTAQITFSDWVLAGGATSPANGDFIAVSTPYRNTPGGKQNMNTYVFYTEVAIPAGATVQSVTLPTTTGGGTMHIFAISTRVGQPYTWQPYNNVGISNDNNPSAAKFDGGTYSYSAQAMQQAGVKPGNVLVFNGATFIWPGAATATADNYVAKGQTIPVNAVYGANYIAFLGASSGGAAKGTATITYTDGTTETIDLGFADWAQGIAQAPTLNGTTQVAFSMPYRNSPTEKNTIHVNVFYYEVLLKNDLPIQSVTLPSSTTGTGMLHVFSISTR